MDLAQFTGLAAAITAGVAQLAKIVGLPDRLAPVVEVVCGVALCIGGVATGAVTTSAAVASAGLFWGAVQGLIAALAAGGVYTYVSNAATAVNKPAP